MNERLRLENMPDYCRERTMEDFLEDYATKPIRNLLQIDVHGLDAEGSMIHIAPVRKPRLSDVVIRVQLSEGISRGEFVYHWNELQQLGDKVWYALGREEHIDWQTSPYKRRS